MRDLLSGSGYFGSYTVSSSGISGSNRVDRGELQILNERPSVARFKRFCKTFGAKSTVHAAFPCKVGTSCRDMQLARAVTAASIDIGAHLIPPCHCRA